MKNEKKQTGRVNYFMILAGGYLIYLAYDLIKGAIKGDTDMPWLGIVAGIAFIGVGAWLLYREWKAYKYGKEHVDDPETWSDDAEMLEGNFAESLDQRAGSAPDHESPASKAEEEQPAEEETGEEEGEEET